MSDVEVARELIAILVRKHPSGVTARYMMREVDCPGATKQAVNRVLYNRLEKKGLVKKDDSLPPQWIATQTLLDSFHGSGVSDRQDHQSHHESQQVHGALGTGRESGPSGRNQPAAGFQPQGDRINPQQLDSSGTRMNPSMGSLQQSDQPPGLHVQPAVQQAPQVIPTAVNVLPPCQHMQVMGGVLAYPQDGRCMTCGAGQAVPMGNVNTYVAAGYQPLSSIVSYPVGVQGVVYDSGTYAQLVPVEQVYSQDQNRQTIVAANPVNSLNYGLGISTTGSISNTAEAGRAASQGTSTQVNAKHGEAMRTVVDGNPKDPRNISLQSLSLHHSRENTPVPVAVEQSSPVGANPGQGQPMGSKVTGSGTRISEIHSEHGAGTQSTTDGPDGCSTSQKGMVSPKKHTESGAVRNTGFLDVPKEVTSRLPRDDKYIHDPILRSWKRPGSNRFRCVQIDISRDKAGINDAAMTEEESAMVGTIRI